MCTCCSSESESEKSAEADVLEDERLKLKQRHVLLLGAGYSGKSTFLNNAVAVFSSGKSDSDKKELIRNIRTSIINQARDLVAATVTRLRNELLKEQSADHTSIAASKQKTDVEMLEETKRADETGVEDTTDMSERRYLSDLEVLSESGKLDEEMVGKIKKLLEHSSADEEHWLPIELAVLIESVVKCPQISATYDSAEGCNLRLFDHYRQHFFDDVVRFADCEYRFRLEDYLMHCTRTTGINSVELTDVAKDSVIVVEDTGGQRSERKKWILVMNNVWCTAVFVDVTCFDKTLYEDEDINAMDESLDLFEQLADYRTLRHVPLLLFFNKLSLLGPKLRSKEARAAFEDYFAVKLPNTSDESEMTEAAMDAIRRAFVSRLPSHRPLDKNLRIIEGDAIKEETIRAFFDEVLSLKPWGNLL